MENKLLINTKNTAVIILSAGKINHKLNILLAESDCPALLPLNNRPLASYSIEFYLNNKLFPTLIIEEEFYDDVVKELKYLDGKFDVLTVNKTKGVVDTIRKILLTVPRKENIIINLVTSIPTDLPLLNQVQIDEKLSENVNWSCINFSDSMNTMFYSKNELQKHIGYAFSGIFHIEHNILYSVLTDNSKQIDDLLFVIEDISKLISLNYKKVNWIDCGHRINYLDSKTKLISSRSFNAVEVDETGVIKKSSKHIEKLEDEFLYYSMLPSEISYFFPRAFDFTKDTSKASYRMEYYGYATVAELQLYWSLDNELWNRFFKRIETILLRFRQHKFSIGEKAFLDFYWNKLVERIEQFEKYAIKNEHSTAFLTEEIIINNTICYSFYSLKDKILEKLYKLYNEEDFCIVHGDFCFNNILFDVHSGIVRLIDPRGSFGTAAKGIYGDFKYDLAKFMHSTVWNYDYIVNYQFVLEQISEQQEYRLVFNKRKNDEILVKLTSELINNLGYSYNDISFLVSLLFLSMTPLHTDSFIKAKAMYLHGISILNKYIN